MLMMSLMHELEGLLHEYLSYNWDRVDSVLDANREALRCARALPARNRGTGGGGGDECWMRWLSSQPRHAYACD